LPSEFVKIMDPNSPPMTKVTRFNDIPCFLICVSVFTYLVYHSCLVLLSIENLSIDIIHAFIF
jgi:hypothetical protein